MPHNRGMDWIRLHKRLAIYHRDSFDCVWCALEFPCTEEGYGYCLTLDHVDPCGGNEPKNLVTCCLECNSRKQDFSLHKWTERLNYYHGYLRSEVLERVERALAKPIDLAEGLRLARLRRPSYPVIGKFEMDHSSIVARGRALKI